MPSKAIDEKNGSLGALPGELQNLVFEHLDHPSAIFLSATNHYFKSLNLTSFVDEERKHDFMTYAKKNFPQHRATVDSVNKLRFGMACYSCYRLKPCREFCWDQRAWELYTIEFKVREGIKPHCLECGEKTMTHSHNGAQRVTMNIRPPLWNAIHGIPCVYFRRSFDFWECDVCLTLDASFMNYGCPKCKKCVRINAGNSMHSPTCGECKSTLLVGRQRQECFDHGLGFHYTECKLRAL